MAQLEEGQRQNAIRAISERLKAEGDQGIDKKTAIEEAEAVVHQDVDGRSVEGLIKEASGKKHKDRYYLPEHLPQPTKSGTVGVSKEATPFLDVTGDLQVTVKGSDFTVEATVQRIVLYRESK
jgi:hypothetical protein